MPGVDRPVFKATHLSSRQSEAHLYSSHSWPVGGTSVTSITWLHPVYPVKRSKAQFGNRLKSLLQRHSRFRVRQGTPTHQSPADPGIRCPLQTRDRFPVLLERCTISRGVVNFLLSFYSSLDVVPWRSDLPEKVPRSTDSTVTLAQPIATSSEICISPAWLAMSNANSFSFRSTCFSFFGGQDWEVNGNFTRWKISRDTFGRHTNMRLSSKVWSKMTMSGLGNFWANRISSKCKTRIWMAFSTWQHRLIGTTTKQRSLSTIWDWKGSYLSWKTLNTPQQGATYFQSPKNIWSLTISTVKTAKEKHRW